MSIKIGSINVFKRLINDGAKIDQTCSGKSPLMYASKYGELEMAKILVKMGANLQITNKGRTVLDYAIKYKQPKMIEYFKKVNTLKAIVDDLFYKLN